MTHDRSPQVGSEARSTVPGDVVPPSPDAAAKPPGSPFEVTSGMVGGAYVLMRQAIAPGQLLWLHAHVGEDQVIIVLKGEMGTRVGYREWTAAAGDVVHRPRGQPHAVWNAGSEPVEFLEITSPGSFEGYFEAKAGVAAGTRTRGDVLREYGISDAPAWEDDLGCRYGVRLSA